MLRSKVPSCLSFVLVILLAPVLFTGVSHAQPANDLCENATTVTDGTYFGTTDDAEIDGAESCSWYGNGSISPDVWFLYTATCDGLLEVDTCGSVIDDTVLSIHEGCDGNEANEIACNDDAGCGPTGWQSSVRTEVVTGAQYVIRVSGWAGATGPFELHISCTPLAPWLQGEDQCEDAVELDFPALVRGSIVGADYDPEADHTVPGSPRAQGNWGCGRNASGATDPNHASPPGVWYRVTGTGNRMAAGVTSEHRVQVYCDGCDRPICVMAGSTWGDPGADTSDQHVTWCSRAGQTYLIWVAASGGWSGGDFELTVTDDGMPCYGAVDCTPVEVIDTYLADNGDNDGWADTNEMVEMYFTVANRSTRDVTGLVARLSADDPTIACAGESEIYIGQLAPGATRLAPTPFRFRVGGAERSSENDEFTAELEVAFASDQFEDLTPRRCSLTGVECVDHADCLGSNFCAGARCSISGGSCRSDFDCAAPGAGDECRGRCSVSGHSCGAGEDAAEPCDEIVDFCVDESQRLRLDLDLDAAGGSGETEFFESFESGGPDPFEEMNLDAGLHGSEASNQYRCPYSGYYVTETPCSLGANPEHAAAYHWQIDDSRAFSGLRSLYMGFEFEPGKYTTPFGTLEAAAIAEPINLGAGRACSGSAGDACAGDGDCPPGQRCAAVIPELSFKHQISLIDHRVINTRGQSSGSQGVVQVQIVDAEGEPIGAWQTIEPKLNRYDSVPSPHYVNVCFFDPIDDGSVHYDRFDFIEAEPPVEMIGMRYLSVGGWYVPHALGSYSGRLGPSSICFPQHVFASAGDTDDPFDPDNLNGPAFGPGLQGEFGIGTWVEPVFSLDRFRGRRIRVRFLTSSMRWGLLEYGSDALQDWDPRDDGWWIDDVRITHTLTEPATVTVDGTDNSALAHDADGDCVADSVDVAPGNDQLWAPPGEVVELLMRHAGGAGGTTTLSWLGASTRGATSVDYVVITQEGASCDEANVGEVYGASDATTPPPGVVRTFLIQAENGWGRGPLGTDSLHNPRTGCD
jgi:hypothetical protein